MHRAAAVVGLERTHATKKQQKPHLEHSTTALRTAKALTLLRISLSSGDSSESIASASDTDAGNSAAVVACGKALV